MRSLYRQNKIAGTHLNVLLLAIGVEALAVIACGLSITTALLRAAWAREITRASARRPSR